MTDPNLPTGTPDPAEVQEMKECPACMGEGLFGESDCCGASIKWTDICEECLEHCDENECDICNGKGELTKQEYDLYKSNE